MPMYRPTRKKPIALAIMLAAYGSAAVAQEQDVVDADAASARASDIEEILVTGSYIKGSPLDAPSPVQSIDRTSIEAQGAAVVWDVIKNLEVNSGSVTNPGSGDNFQVEGTANVNLRNLGENSTLTLVNGKRQVPAALTTRSGGEYVDLNAIPLVMTERVEILTDGGSALYGSDAVAGVVNIIMRTDFEGLEVYGDIQGIQAADNEYDKTASIIWGWASDNGNTHLVLSAERFERDPVSVEHANFFDERSEFTGNVGAAPSGQAAVINSPFFGGSVNPDFINWDIMAQNIAATGNDDFVYTDPQCYSMTAGDGTPFFTGRRSDRSRRNQRCLPRV
jgi:iron complex outermembrane receptor protein